MGKATHLTKQEEETIVDLYIAGRSAASIAAEYKIREIRVTDLVRSARGAVRKGPSKRYDFDDFCPKGLHVDHEDRGSRSSSQGRSTYYCKPCLTEYHRQRYHAKVRSPEHLRKKREDAKRRRDERRERLSGGRELTAQERSDPRSPEAYIRKLSHRSRVVDGTITREELISLWDQQNGRCAISGVPMTYIIGTGHRVDTNISLDRIDSDKGYEPRNVQLVCAQVNIMKQRLAVDELRRWCRLILENG